MRVPIAASWRPRLSEAAVRMLDRRGFAETRRRLLAGASGATLEIGAGTGANAGWYPPSLAPLVVSEPDHDNVRRLRGRLAEVAPSAIVVESPAEALPFPDAAFDTVVSTLVLCSVDDPDAALAEIRRVLRPGGALLFAEHVRAADPAAARRQDRLSRPWGFVAGGCRPNRDTVAAIERAGFRITELRLGRLPAGPSIVRPLATGRAERTGG